jgi:hypothetical protein
MTQTKVNYVVNGRWMLCYHCEAIVEFESGHYCGALWQTPAHDMPPEWCERTRERSTRTASLELDAKRLGVAAASYAGADFAYGFPLGPRSVLLIDLPDGVRIDSNLRDTLDRFPASVSDRGSTE